MSRRHGTKVISPTQRNEAYRNIALIYNPFAGGLGGWRFSRLLDASKALGRYGAEVELLATKCPRSAGTLAARAIDDGADLIVVAGGDGSINEALEGMAGTDTPLAILPAGTANVLAREMRVPRNLPSAAAALLSYPVERVSTGLIQSPDENPRPFLLMAGAGLDAHVVYSLNIALKRRLGKMAYWLAGFQHLGRTLEEFTVRVDGREYEASFALISKVRNYGGDLEIAQEVTLLDDEFEVVLFHGRNSWRYVGYLAAVATRQIRLMKGITILRASEIELGRSRDDRVFVQVDGEFAGRLPARVEIVPATLSLAVPPEYIRAHPRALAQAGSETVQVNVRR
jgi:diacylglycerol kinase (ATP)